LWREREGLLRKQPVILHLCEMTGWIEPSFFSVFFVVSSTLAQL
jgi:hypothetical protein